MFSDFCLVTNIYRIGIIVGQRGTHRQHVIRRENRGLRTRWEISKAYIGRKDNSHKAITDSPHRVHKSAKGATVFGFAGVDTDALP